MRLLLFAIYLFCLAPIALGGDRVVVVHPDTSVDDVSTADLKGIFKADQQHWDSKTRVYLVLPKSKTSANDFLLERVYGMTDRELARHWIQQIYRNKISIRPKQFSTSSIMLRVLKKKTGSVAVIDVGDLPEKHGLKVLTVDGKRRGEAGYSLAETSPKADDDEQAVVAKAEDTGLLSASFAQDEETDFEARISALENQLADQELEALFEGETPEDFLSGPRLKLQGFGHVQFLVDDVESRATGTDNSFAIGGLDLFLTSRLSENVSFLNETVFEPTSDGDYVLDVERIIFRYEVSDALNIETGRFHTTTGRWNELYHHGEYLQTSAGRPAVLNFEDENGILPVHMVGLAFKGRKKLSNVALDYAFEVGNGRGPTPDPPQIVSDENDNKAFNLSIAVQPAAVRGLRIGSSYYRDKIPTNTDPTNAPVHGVIDETIFNLSVEYERNDWRVLAEVFDIEHKSTVDTSSIGWYAEVSHHVGLWTPFVRLDGVHLDDQDLFFASVDDTTTGALGTRYELSDWSALKLQYAHTDYDLAAGGSDEKDALLFQISFAF